MNSASTKRLISRQEALVLLGDLDLVLCSDVIKTVSLTASKRIATTSDNKEDKNLLSKYRKRAASLEHLSLYEFFRLTHAVCTTTKKNVVPHFVGICGSPTYPVSENYAKQTLVIHKPWRIYPTSDNWIKEFNNFINHPDAPVSATVPYQRAMQRYYAKTQFVEPVASKPDLSSRGISEETQELLDLVGMAHTDNLDYDAQLLQSLDRGLNYHWDKPPKVSENDDRYFLIYYENPDLTFLAQVRSLVNPNLDPSSWLCKKTKEYYAEDQEKGIDIPLKSDGSKYRIDDLYDDQKYVVGVVMDKLREWTTCADLKQFKPLRLTINGAGGCGKSVIINTLVTAMRQMFDCNDVVKVCAPTGTAAFNVGGTTLHHLVKMGIESTEYIPNSLSIDQRKALVGDFKSLLALIIDERSLLSSRDLGTAERRIAETIHNGGFLNHLSFGGLPVLILVGDDYQLPATGSGAIDALTHDVSITSMLGRGRQVFLECAKTVLELKTSRRLRSGQHNDRIIMEKIRTRQDLSDSEVNRILNLHMDKMKQVWNSDELAAIEKEAMYLFFRNEPRVRHNIERIKICHSETNPVAFIRVKSEGSAGKAIGRHFKRGSVPETAVVCLNSIVALDGINFCPEWGLHNGALGYIREIVYAEKKSPNKGDLPEYVVVEFPNYRGPAWDVDNENVRRENLLSLKISDVPIYADLAHIAYSLFQYP